MAIEHTAVKRDSMDMLKDWKDIMRDMRKEIALYSLRRNYAAPEMVLRCIAVYKFILRKNNMAVS